MQRKTINQLPPANRREVRKVDYGKKTLVYIRHKKPYRTTSHPVIARCVYCNRRLTAQEIEDTNDQMLCSDCKDKIGHG